VKATIYINRHIVNANKKASKTTQALVDDPAITIRTHLGTLRCKQVVLTQSHLIQDAANAHCSGATIWLETTFETLIIDGQTASRDMFDARR
jgi:hypothetical protein